MITNHLHNLPWNKADTPSLENFKLNWVFFQWDIFIKLAALCFSWVGEWRKCQMEFVTLHHEGRSLRRFCYLSDQTSFLVVCSDRISLLKSELTHYVFLQKCRKAPQKNKYGKFDEIAQVNILWTTHRRVFMHADFCFFSELHLCKYLYVSITTDSCCIFCDLTQFYTKGLHLMPLFFFSPLCVLPVGIQFVMIIESQCHFNRARFLPF